MVTVVTLRAIKTLAAVLRRLEIAFAITIVKSLVRTFGFHSRLFFYYLDVYTCIERVNIMKSEKKSYSTLSLTLVQATAAKISRMR